VFKKEIVNEKNINKQIIKNAVLSMSLRTKNE